MTIATVAPRQVKYTLTASTIGFLGPLLFTPDSYQTSGQWTKVNHRALCTPPRLRFIASVEGLRAEKVVMLSNGRGVAWVKRKLL